MVVAEPEVRKPDPCAFAPLRELLARRDLTKRITGWVFDLRDQLRLATRSAFWR